MGNHDNGFFMMIDVLENSHHLLRHFRIEIPSGLICKDHIRIIYQTSDDGSQVVYEVDSTSTSFQILDLAEGSYSFQISTVELEQEGDKSPPIAGITTAAI